MAERISVLHDAAGVVVVDKPAGLETAGRTLDDPRSVQHRLAAQLGRPVWAVHQLDRDTSGVCVFVRKRSLVAVWQAELKPPRARKFYFAIVHGRLAAESMRIDEPLRYDEARRRWTVGEGREAHTRVRRLAVTEQHSALEVELLTGRTHQARVHLAHVGHPLVGEQRYREPSIEHPTGGRLQAPPPSTEESPRQALHAWRIELAAGQAFVAPIPQDLRALAARLGLSLSLP